MSNFCIVPHPGRPEAIDLARSTAKWLSDHGHTVRVDETTARTCHLSEWSTPNDALTVDLDLVVSMGGDGTMLRAVDLVSGSGVPVLGVNFGSLGYLTQIEPAELISSLERFHKGDYQIEERMTLDVSVDLGDRGVFNYNALNEAVLEKTVSGQVAQLAISIDDRPFLTYAADGVIVATPTGSTAYNLSARGPIVSPHLKAILMTPVSPHMLFDRPLILDATQTLRFEVIGKLSASLVVDGNATAVLEPLDSVTYKAGSRPARLVRFDHRDFHRILKKKFGLADR